jgi:RNA polymerase sigma factor (TIGR02999 family)
MGDVTVLLEAARQGEISAVGRIFELLHPELKRLARAHLRDRSDRLLMDAGVLVNEAYLRMLSTQRLTAVDRGHFLAYVAQVMRCVVVDIVREQQAGRREGGQHAFLTLDTLALGAAVQQGEEEILAVHAALEELAQIDARLVRVVEMRYFVGLSNQETADSLGVAATTVEREWEKAHTYLQHSLTQG